MSRNTKKPSSIANNPMAASTGVMVQDKESKYPRVTSTGFSVKHYRGRKRGIVDRDLLLDTAASLFAIKGYRATSLDDIASELGMKKSSLYHYIASKQEILIDLYNRIYELVEDKINSIAADSDLEPDERLRRMVLSYIESITTYTDMFAMALRNEHELPEKYESMVLRRHRRMEQVFESVILEGQEKGQIVGLQPRLIGLAMFGMVLFIQYWFKKTKFTADEISSALITLLENGWRPREAHITGTKTNDVAEAIEGSRELIRQLESGISELNVSLDKITAKLAAGGLA